MKEMTDRELTDKISQVFDNFEDPNAQYGWRELRKKYPGSGKQPVILWWASAAAVLLVLCGLWFIAPISNINDTLVKKPPHSQSMDGDLIDKEVSSERSDNIENNSPIPAPVENTDEMQYKTPPETRISRENNLPERSPKNQVQDAELSSSALSGRISQSDIELSAVTPFVNVHRNKENDNTLLISREEPDPKQNSLSFRDSMVDLAAGKLARLAQGAAVDEHAHQVVQVPYNSRKSRSETNAFSVFAGSFFNYSLGSETTLSFGAGFTSDIRIASNLKISTGLALAKNTLTFNNGVPSSSTSRRAYDAVPSFVHNNGFASNSLTTVTKYNANLLALDIPINMKYLIIPKDNKLYMSAGLSSGTYLHENYSLEYRHYSPSGTYLNQNQGVEVENQLQTFDFASTLNISFGYSANFGKAQNVTIEPFLKYPLGGLGSENLKFGAAGVNLKLNFSKFK